MGRLDFKNLIKQERGYALVVILILMALTAFVVRESLKRVGVSSTIISASRTSSLDYVDVEHALNKAVSFMMTNSSKFSYVFSKENFYTMFERSSTPVFGENDTSTSQVASKILLRGTLDVGLLLNEPDLFGYENFPNSKDSATNGDVELIGALSTVDFAGIKVRITLFDAIPITVAGDTPPNPTTDFKPIWRIDALTALDSGPHVFAFLEGTPQRAGGSPKYWAVYAHNRRLSYYGGVGSDIPGLAIWSNTYGQTYTDPSQTGCSSYDSSLGVYSNSNRGTDCFAGSQSASTTTLGYTRLGVTTLWGSLLSNSGSKTRINASAQVCSGFGDATLCKNRDYSTSSCSSAGCMCLGTGCVTGVDLQGKGLENINSTTPKYWSDICSSGNVGTLDKTNTKQTVTIGSTTKSKCWTTWTLRGSTVFTLTSSGDYYVRDFSCGGLAYATKPAHGTTAYVMANPPAGGVVRLWIFNALGNWDTTCFRNGTSYTTEALSNNGSPSRFQINLMHDVSSITKVFPQYWPAPALNAFLFSYGPIEIWPTYQTDIQSKCTSSDCFFTVNGAVYSANSIVLGDVAIHYDKAGETTGLSWQAAGSGLGSGGGGSKPGWVSASYTGGAYDVTYGVRQIVRVYK